MSPTIERELGSTRRVTAWRVVALLLVWGLLAAACGGDDGGTGTAADDTSDADTPDEPAGDDVALANAIRIDASVDARIADATDYTGITDPTAVNAGDNVRTDTTGFAEIAYFDGSVTRLDIDTDFTVVELTDSPGDSVIRTQMGVGRTWHRVQALTGNDTYEVETTVATAVVRGTAFWIVCRSETSCTFAVVEGTIEVILPDGTVIVLTAPESLTIDAGDVGDPQPLPFDSGFYDDWLLDNGRRDVDNGFAGPGEIYQQHGPAYAGLEGTHSGSGQIDTVDCSGPGCEAQATEIFAGKSIERTYEFNVGCNGAVCGGRAVTEWESQGERVRDNVPLSHDGSGFAWDAISQSFACFDGDGNELGQTTGALAWRLTPTAASLVGDRYLIMDAQVSIVIEAETAPPFEPFCEPAQYEYVLTETLDVSRVTTGPAGSEGTSDEEPPARDDSDRAATEYRQLNAAQQETTDSVCRWAQGDGVPDIEYLFVVSGETGVWELEDSFNEIGPDSAEQLRVSATRICDQIDWPG